MGANESGMSNTVMMSNKCNYKYTYTKLYTYMCVP